MPTKKTTPISTPVDKDKVISNTNAVEINRKEELIIPKEYDQAMENSLNFSKPYASLSVTITVYPDDVDSYQDAQEWDEEFLDTLMMETRNEYSSDEEEFLYLFIFFSYFSHIFSFFTFCSHKFQFLHQILIYIYNKINNIKLINK